jgi:hypothetical protein
MSIENITPAGHLASEKVGIVSLNQMGATTRQDAGRDAQILADRFGLLTLAVDRPGSTGWFNPFLKKQITTDYIGAMNNLAKDIAHEAYQEGLEGLILTGRSAGALGAMGLILTDQMPSIALYSVESAGMNDVPTWTGGIRLKSRYDKESAGLLEGDELRVLPPKQPDVKGKIANARRGISMVAHTAVDQYHNYRLWGTMVGLDFAQRIASGYPRCDTTLELASLSYAGYESGPDRYEHVVSALQYIATQRDPNGAPFIVGTVDGTTHSSYDNIPFFTDRLVPTVQRAIQLSEQA